MCKNVCSEQGIRPCSGCGMCASLCPTKAIEIMENKDGFYRPVVYEEKCSSCSMCMNVCYRFDEEFKIKENEDHRCFSAINLSEEELSTSSSGGVSIELMRQCIAQGYHVVGVAYDAKQERAVTRIATKCDELEQFKGSKYFQSVTVNAFESVIRDKSEQKYAIFGTPCQIYAFAKIAEIQKNRERYILVDIFCHGCPSLKLWDRYLSDVKSRLSVKMIEHISFRSKKHGWHEYCFEFNCKGINYVSSKYQDPFYELFFGADIMNDACYNCVARSTVEKCDLRIGDFWGSKYDSDSRGVSAVIVVTIAGSRIFENIANKFEIAEADFSEIISNQSYKKAYTFDSERRKLLLEGLCNDKPIRSIVRSWRRYLPLSRRMYMFFRNYSKCLPTRIYLWLKKKYKRD